MFADDDPLYVYVETAVSISCSSSYQISSVSDTYLDVRKKNRILSLTSSFSGLRVNLVNLILDNCVATSVCNTLQPTDCVLQQPSTPDRGIWGVVYLIFIFYVQVFFSSLFNK